MGRLGYSLYKEKKLRRRPYGFRARNVWAPPLYREHERPWRMIEALKEARREQ